MKTLKQDQALMSLLKLSDISRIICETNLGTLRLKLRKGETNYFLTLDAVELDKQTNKEVMELLFPPLITTVATTISTATISLSDDNVTSIKTKKKTYKPKKK